jgi:hypothetical protein
MKFKKFLSPVLFSLILTSLSYAETVSFPVRGLVTVSDEPAIIKCEWNEKWFGEKSAYHYNHGLARIAAILANVAYEQAEKDPDNNLIIQCLKKLGFTSKLIEQHYSINYNNSVWGNNQSAFTFASKQIQSAKGPAALITVVIRGTPLSSNEWLSNLNISDRTQKAEDFHEGFSKAAKQVENALIAYILKNKIDIDNCYLLLTGHSRGAAIANLLGAQLLDTELFKASNIYDYTFASPNVTTLDAAENPKYGFIWNIVNAEDVVPTVPFNMNNWKYKKYGNIKAIINDWNTDYQKYESCFIPQMNIYFQKLMMREYCPFKTGPFLPVECKNAMAERYPEVSDFYSGLASAHSLAYALLKMVFLENKIQEEPLSAQESAKKNSGFISWYTSRVVNREFGMDTQELINTCVDMHASETYLAWLLALEEDEVYSNLGTNLILIKGPGNYAVFDENNTLLASIIDGKVEFSKIKLPAAANSFLQNQVVIGLPENRSFKIVLSHESLIPTPLKVTVQNYGVSGELVKTSPAYKLYASVAHVWTFDSVKDTLESQPPVFKKEKWKETAKLRREGEIRKHSEFKVLYEFSGNTSGTINTGVHIGSSNFYGSMLLGHNVLKQFKTMEASPGFGTQAILFGRILLNIELYSNFMYIFSDRVKDEDRFNIVPSTRFLLSYKPKQDFQFFAGVNFDTHISGYNDANFDDVYRLKIAGEVWTGSKIRFVPNFTAGIKI